MYHEATLQKALRLFSRNKGKREKGLYFFNQWEFLIKEQHYEELNTGHLFVTSTPTPTRDRGNFYS